MTFNELNTGNNISYAQTEAELMAILEGNSIAKPDPHVNIQPANPTITSTTQPVSEFKTQKSEVNYMWPVLTITAVAIGAYFILKKD